MFFHFKVVYFQLNGYYNTESVSFPKLSKFTRITAVTVYLHMYM